MTYCENYLCFPCLCIMYFCGKCYECCCCTKFSEIEPEHQLSS